MQGGDAGSIASIIIDFVVVVQVGSCNIYVNILYIMLKPFLSLFVQDWALDIITVYLFAV